jgi:hypothetical protein
MQQREIGPSTDPERARRLASGPDLPVVRHYEVNVTTAATGTVVSHDLRETLIPQVTPLGAGNTVQVLSVDFGQATLRVTAGAACRTAVTFRRVDRQP